MHHVRQFLYQSGGIRLTPQQRSERHLTGSEREEISRGIAAGESARHLAKRLGRSPSTISREIARNGGRNLYRAASADAAAYTRERRPKQAKLAQRPALRALVEAKLALCWSPEQIAGWLRRQFPGDTSMQISHEAIYLSLYAPPAGARRSTAASPSDCGQPGRCAARRSPVGPPGGGSSAAWCPSRPAPPRSRTARSPAIGRATVRHEAARIRVD
ncbi:transposase [Streptomyces sp. CAS3]